MNSVFTFDQSTASSSARSWAIEVIVPWPISMRAMRIVVVLSDATVIQSWISTVS
jgi:hypothetical protein